MNEREEIIKRLNALELSGGSHEMLSSIANAVSPDAMFGWTIGACNLLRARLANLLSDDEAYQRGYDEGFASADDWLAQHEDAMAEHGWYKALDGDKAPIRIGDKVDSDHHEDGTVTGVKFYEMANGGIRTLVAVRPDGWDVATWYAPDEYHHHKPPTVEDVLHSFICDVEEGMRIEDDIIAEYAAKLRLAGDAE